MEYEPIIKNVVKFKKNFHKKYRWVKQYFPLDWHYHSEWEQTYRYFEQRYFTVESLIDQLKIVWSPKSMWRFYFRVKFLVQSGR